MPRDRREPPPPPPDSVPDSADSFMREAAAFSEPAPSEVPAVAPLEPGELVAGRFRIERRAGHGGMGTVYRAGDASTGGHAAVKVMAKQSKSVAARFLREAEILAELSHPAVVRYIAHGTTADGEPFLAMEWLEGEDLAERLTRGALGVGESLAVVRRAAEGLAIAHARGVVHRDLKPSNLFLVGGDAGRATVIDFGVARVAAWAVLTRPGASLGTVGYMAPEQAIEAADVDARADVYGLGCVLFECLTGRPPLVGRHADLLVKVLREVPPRVSELRAGAGEAIDALVARLLAKDRAQRPRDALDLVRAIDALVMPTQGQGTDAR
jgi:serine/threonine protein kinase